MIVPADTMQPETPGESAADPLPPAAAPASAPAAAWRSRLYLYAALFVLGLVILARNYPPETSRFLIADHLDGNFPRYVILSRLPLIGGLDDLVPQLMGGVPRNSMPSSLTAYSLLFRLVPPPWVLVLNEILMRVAALFGMWLLLRGHLLRGLHPFGAAATALAFALLPFWPPGCLCIAGQPLLFWALLNLRAGRLLLLSFLIVALFPFFSLLVMIGWVLALVCGAMTLEALARRNWRAGWLALALAILVLGYAVVEYRLLYQLLFDRDYVSHRTTFTQDFFALPFSRSRSSFAWQLFSVAIYWGPFHSLAVQAPALLFGFPLVLGAYCLLQRLRPGSSTADSEGAFRLLLGCIGIIFLGALAFVLQQHPESRSRLMRALPGAFATINISRVGWLAPAAWYIGLGACAAILFSHGRLLRLAGMAFLVAQCTLLYDFDYPRQRPGGHLTFDRFYAPSMFAEIRDFIGRPQSEYRVASVAMLPAIAQYNGFYTVDGYLPDYPLEYKERFRRVIAERLELNATLKSTFDSWGSKCYLFVGDFPGMWQYSNLAYVLQRGDRPRELAYVNLDIGALVGLGTEYIFSAYPIKHAERKNLKFVRVFKRPHTAPVFLYRTRIGKVPEGQLRARQRRAWEAAHGSVAG